VSDTASAGPSPYRLVTQQVSQGNLTGTHPRRAATIAARHKSDDVVAAAARSRLICRNLTSKPEIASNLDSATP
jgi:hypothetical protein